jgi:DNA-binding MarR family transcriptional regulator
MAEERAISALEDHVGYWLRFVSNHVSHAFLRKLEANGVTGAEWVLLRALYDAGVASPSRLADRLGMSRGAVSKLVARLHRKGLAERSHAGGDRRSQALSLTESGRALVPALSRLADDNDREFFGHLDRGRKDELVELLRSLVQRHGWKDVPVS